MIKHFGTSIAVLALIALGVGCGSDESDSAPAAAMSFDSSVTHAQYRKQANAICNEAKSEMVFSLQKRAKEEGKASVLEIPPQAQVEILLASMRNALEEIREVTAPAEGKQEVERLVDTFQASITAIDEEELQSVQEIEPVLLRIYRAATAYQLPGCAYGR